MRHGLIAAACAVAIGVGVAAAERKVQMKDLPAAVQAAVQKELTGATLKGLTRETENGKTQYEAETIRNGHARDLLFDAKGRLIEAEEEIALTDAPAAVQAALAARGTVVRVETVTKGTAVSYEGVVEKNGKKTEVAVGADGKVSR